MSILGEAGLADREHLGRFSTYSGISVSSMDPKGFKNSYKRGSTK